MGFKYAKFSTYFQGNRHYGKKFPLQSSEKYQPKIYFLSIEKLLKFILDIAMISFCLNCFIITCKGRT